MDSRSISSSSKGKFPPIEQRRLREAPSGGLALHSSRVVNHVPTVLYESVPRKPSSRPKRAPLSTERIAAAALQMVDHDGLEALSFRALAKELRCEAMSLYHYFPSKAHLLDAMVDIYLSELTFLPEREPWIDQLRHAAHEFRKAALRHPGLFPFYSVYRQNSRSGLAYLNRIVKIMELGGLSTEARARHFRVLGYYLTGASLDEALGYAKGPSAAEPVPSDMMQKDYPAIMAISGFFDKDHHLKTFELGLEMLLARIAKDAARGSTKPDSARPR
jgi:AcrR family transcriptional regulator